MQKDIFSLDISMNQVFGVHIVKSIQYFRDDYDGFLKSELIVGPRKLNMMNIALIAILHQHEDPPFIFKSPNKSNNIFMLQITPCIDFLLYVFVK